MISEANVPSAYSSINRAARFNAYFVKLISIPLSKRKEASVFRACLFADLRIETGLK